MAEQTSGSAGNLDSSLTIPEPVVVTLQSSATSPITAPSTTGDVGSKPAEVVSREIPEVEITMDDFENAKLSIKPSPPASTLLPTDKPLDTKPLAQTDKADIGLAKGPSPEATKTSPRDYTGIHESDIPKFSKMSNDAFAFVKSKFKEFGENYSKLQEEVKQRDLKINQLSEGKPQLPESYYEHEKAFVLAPEWNEASVQLNLVSAVQDHWSKQLTNIREGKPWNTLKDDGRGGVAIDNTPIPADAASEAKIFTYLQHSALQLNKQQQKVLDIERDFGSKVRANTELVSAANKQYFGMFEDPKHEAAPLKQQIVAALPATFKNNPLLPMLVNSLAANVLFRRENDSMRKAQVAEAGKNTRIATASSNSGPTDSSIAAGTSNGVKGAAPSLDNDENLFLKFQERMAG